MTTGLESLLMLFPRWRVDIEHGRAFATPARWLQWGYVTELRRRWRRGEFELTPVEWYIVIRLPSYLMKHWEYAGPGSEPRWHQRVLVFREKLPCDDGPWGEGKWQMQEWCL